MPIDEISPEKRTTPGDSSSQATRFIVIVVVLALLAIGEIFTINRMSSTKDALEIAQAKTSAELIAKVDDQMATLQHQNAQVLEGIKAELDSSVKRVGMTQSEVPALEPR